MPQLVHRLDNASVNRTARNTVGTARGGGKATDTLDKIAKALRVFGTKYNGKRNLTTP